MKAILIASIAALTTAAFAAAASGAPSSAAGRCYAKEAKIRGKSVIVNCGPASASSRFAGKTYSFKGGTCLRTGQSVMLDLGTALVDDSHGNGGIRPPQHHDALVEATGADQCVVRQALDGRVGQVQRNRRQGNVLRDRRLVRGR